MIYRPWLEITAASSRERVSEVVEIAYQSSVSNPYLAVSTAIKSAQAGKGRYIRAWVYNQRGAIAHNCRVFVNNEVFCNLGRLHRIVECLAH